MAVPSGSQSDAERECDVTSVVAYDWLSRPVDLDAVPGPEDGVG